MGNQDRGRGYEVIDSGAMVEGCAQYGTLRQHYLFSGLDEGAYRSLAAGVQLRHFERGRVLFQTGESAHSFFFVDSGQVELILNSASGERKTLEVIGPGRTFAEAVAFMRRVKYPVTAEVLEDCCLCEIPIGPYTALLDGNPNACFRLLGDLSAHLHARVREIERLTVQNARGRLASYLLDHVIDANEDTDEATVRLELPRHVIASRLSIKPETLSRLLRNLVDEGVVTIEDRVIFVHSLGRLRPYD